MKRFILFFIFYFLFFTNCYSQWVTSYTNPATQHFECFFINEYTGWLGGDGSKVFKSTNCGVTWDSIYSNSSNIIYCMYFIDANTGWAGTYTGDVMKTTNGGHNWVSVAAVYNKRIWDIYFINETTGWCVGGEGTLEKTTNGGNTWFNLTQSFYTSELYGVHFTDTQNGIICGSNCFAKTSNGGNNWETENYPGVCFSAMYFLNPNTGWLYGARLINGNALALFTLKTINSGVNWNVIYSDSSVSTGAYLYVKDVHFINENLGYYVGLGGQMGPSWSTYGIMKKTTNAGINWSSVNYGYISSLEALTFVNQQTGFATGGDGAVLKTTNGGTVFISQQSGDLPDNYKLFQNYPNPFNPSTIIRYSIPQSVKGEMSNVKLVVYDILGKEIASLVNEKQSPGEYEVPFSINQFSGYQLPSGIYFYTLRAGDYTETKKMLLIK